MHEMRTTAINDPVAWSVGLSRGFTRFRCANTAERMEVLFVVETLGNPSNTVLEGSRFSHGFDTAFAKLLWPLVVNVFVFRAMTTV